MEKDVHDGDVESQDVDQPIEIAGESPHFVLHNGRGRLELFTKTKNGILRFTTIMLGSDGVLRMTNETGSNSVGIRSCRTQIGRNFQDDLFKGYASTHVSRNHCELIIHNRGSVDFTAEMSIEISIENADSRLRNGTYYKHYE